MIFFPFNILYLSLAMNIISFDVEKKCFVFFQGRKMDNPIINYHLHHKATKSIIADNRDDETQVVIDSNFFSKTVLMGR